MRPGLLSERARPQLAPDLAPEWIVYEDDDVIVLDKPAGVPCQAASSACADDLPSRLQRFLAARRGVSVEQVYVGTHQRLDQETSGLILYTLRKEANASMAAQLEQRSVHKRYVAVVCAPQLPQGERLLSHWLAPGRDGRMQLSDEADPRAKLAKTRLRVLERNGDRALLELTLETGRTHQIRAQLAALGAPVAGDALYGHTPAMRLMLHSHELVFAHPADGRRIELRAPVPLPLSDFIAHGARPAYSDPALMQDALALALQARFRLGRAFAAGETTAFRLVHGAADGFDDLAVEVFADWLVVRVTGEAPAPQLQGVLDALDGLGFSGIYLKRHPKQASDLVDPRDERIAPALPVRGEPAPAALRVFENGLPFEVQLGEGLRSGLFLDQRDNRRRLYELASGKRVLNLFGYTGSFSVAALAGGAAHVTTVDLSRAALDWAQRNVAAVGGEARHRWLARDAFDALARFATKHERFDVIVLDPPSYSTSKRGRFRAQKDYAGLCRDALATLADQGTLLACLNHHGVTQATLRRFIHTAAASAGCTVLRMKDLSEQLDFPAEVGQEPLAKSVLVQLRRQPGGAAAGARPARRF
ncbi:MAG TPA: class I SAM-dependent methyltransferase [Polyangiales bacterium]